MTNEEQSQGSEYIRQLAQDCELLIDNFLNDDKVIDEEKKWIIKMHVVSKMIINMAFNRNQDNVEVRKWFRDHWVPIMIKRINATEITFNPIPPSPADLVKHLMRKGNKK